MRKAIMFDMNGVLIDDERIHQQSWRDICEELGIKLTEDEFTHRVFGRTEKDTFEFILGREVDDEELARLSDERVQGAIRIADKEAKMPEGLKRFLDEAKRQGIVMGVATSSRRKYFNYVMIRFDLSDYFIGTVTAEEITNGKPDPEIYVMAAQHCGVDPKECIAIEDSVSGIKSAQAAGMKVIGLTTTHDAKELEKADLVVDSFSAINPKKVLSI